MRLNGAGIHTDPPETGRTAVSRYPGAGTPCRPRCGREARNGGPMRCVGARRRAAGKRVPANAHPLAVYCSDACKRGGEERAAGRGGPGPRSSNGAAPSQAKIPSLGSPGARGSARPDPPPPMAPGPAAVEGIVGLVVELVERGADVELERDGWRLTVHLVPPARASPAASRSLTWWTNLSATTRCSEDGRDDRVCVGARGAGWRGSVGTSSTACATFSTSISPPSGGATCPRVLSYLERPGARRPSGACLADERRRHRPLASTDRLLRRSRQGGGAGARLVNHDRPLPNVLPRLEMTTPAVDGVATLVGPARRCQNTTSGPSDSSGGKNGNVDASSHFFTPSSSFSASWGSSPTARITLLSSRS